MAIFKGNIFTQGLRGLFGKQAVFRTQKGRTIMSAPPKRRRKQSEAQLKQRNRFGEATYYAKRAIADEDVRKFYDKKAQQSAKLQTAFNVAVADFMCVPEIRNIDMTDYKGEVGNQIIIRATDDFMVRGVKVEIQKGDGSLIELGDAKLMPNGLDWAYSVQYASFPYEGNIIIVRAFDLPRNMCEEKVICG